jgi:membrane-bound ClpP family serine protease
MEFITFINGIVANLDVISIFCLLFGLILVIIEMFHPGFGVPGIAGAILLIVGVILTADSLIEALFLMSILLAILCVVLVLVLHSATKGKLSKKLILRDEQKKETGYIGTEDLDYFLDKEGVANTVLRPSGTADLDGVKMDVVTQGEYVEKGAKIKIVKVQGRRIVVKQIK